MHCWKTINVQKLYGHDRIFLLSMIVVFAVFSFFYIAINVFINGPISDSMFPLFLVLFLMTYPMHKLLHFLPVARFKKHLRYDLIFRFGLIPTLNMRIHEPIVKSRYMLSLMMPFIVINSAFIVCAMTMPTYRHYFTILLAYHSGLCLIDLLYVKHLLKTPKKALIEETAKGFEVLIPVSNGR
ncbi:DUF3267 domain-containing protein [Kurthia sibirica]|uniref:DUF3267 domain-containing protein n=1 Tax=Kurthia sibirica TaxID=202750 RepID=A0A2U3AJB2_9BACL|nr:DUF3267 domain-containing protein [Kurthia sibirica]PWI24656.1 DUF3267 domain-containing protein [Kurthia sibirica]GEK33488.1 hypothetical protein KSI01_10210 [Kurthia sibirica]